MRIRRQLALASALFATLLVGVILSAGLTNAAVKKAADREMLANKIAQSASFLTYLSTAYLIYLEPQQLERWENTYTSFSHLVVSLHAGTAEQIAIVRDIQANEVHLKEVFDEVRANAPLEYRGDVGIVFPSRTSGSSPTRCSSPVFHATRHTDYECLKR